MKKVVPKPARGGAARKSSPAYLKLNFNVGDRVLVIDIPEDTKDPKADLKSPEAREMRTAELFRFCLGKTFTVYGWGRYGHIELRVGRNREVRQNFGWSHTIWIEPEFLKLVKRKATNTRTRD
ncbi:MAG TPA: hypothetical protein VF133_02400 [Terriglobales bacterium]